MRKFIAAAALAAPLLYAAGASAEQFAVGPQYDSTHVYVTPADVDRFVASFIATFGGSAGNRSEVTVTPTPSRTINQPVHTPVGMLSVFGFTTPIPAPFGSERVGYLVTDMDKALAAARSDGAAVIVAPFPDAIGRDAVVQWPGGVNMQFYWHTTPPSYDALAATPESRVYVSPDRADDFVRAFLKFSEGRVVSDDAAAAGIEIGRAGTTYRRIRIESLFGKMTVLSTDGHLPFPYGHETMGYAVQDLIGTLAKAQAAGAVILVSAYDADHRKSAMVQFPGGYIAEIHASAN